MVLMIAETHMPKNANPSPVTNPMNGTSSMPHVGVRPKKNVTISGKVP